MPAPRAPFFPILVAALAAMAPTPAGAEPTPSEINVARRLFDEGKAAADSGRHQEASEKFRQASAIKDTPGIRFHLARSQEEQGALVEALVEYDRARELLDSGVKAADVERLLPAARDRVQAKVAQVTVRLPADVADVSVSLDGKAVSTSVLGVPLPVNPGSRLLRASAAGRSPFEQRLDLSPGERREITIVLPPRATPKPAPRSDTTAIRRRTPPRPADSRGSTRTILLVGEGSLLAAGLGTGIIFSIARGSAEDRFERADRAVLAEVGGEDAEGTACSGPEPAAACPSLEQARKERTRARALATVGFVTAGFSAAALGATWLLWPSGNGKPQVGVAVTPTEAQLSLNGRF